MSPILCPKAMVLRLLVDESGTLRCQTNLNGIAGNRPETEDFENIFFFDKLHSHDVSRICQGVEGCNIVVCNDGKEPQVQFFDRDENIWCFQDINGKEGSLLRLNPKTREIKLYPFPIPISTRGPRRMRDRLVELDGIGFQNPELKEDLFWEGTVCIA